MVSSALNNNIKKMKPIKIKTRKKLSFIPIKLGGKLIWFEYFYRLTVTHRVLLDEILEFDVVFDFKTIKELNKKLEDYDLTKCERSEKI